MSGGVLLGPSDVFQRVHDGDMRAEGRAGNLTAFVMELDGHVDVSPLRARLDRAAALVPELSGRVSGLFPWQARWSTGGLPPPPVRLREAEGCALDELAAELVDEPIATGGPVAIDVLRREASDAVVLRVHHTLADAKALERLAQWLGEGTDAEPSLPPAERFAPSPLRELSRARRFELMRAYNARVIELGAKGIASPASPHGAPSAKRAAPPRTRSLRIHLEADETRRFDSRVRREARLAETAVLLLSATRAVDDLLLGRGLAPPRFVVPVPASLDPKAGATRLLGNYVTLLMFSLDRAELADDAAALASLAKQQRAIVRGRLDLGALAALDFARWLPRLAYRRLERGPMRGEIGSFVLSNPGSLSIGSFFGRRVVDAYPLPAVVSSPGLQVIATRFEDRLSVTLAFLDHRVTSAEAARLHDVLLGELLQTRPTAARSALPAPDLD